MAVPALISHWRSEPTVADNISAWMSIPARQALIEPLPDEIDEELVGLLRSHGIESLYKHQGQAWRYFHNLENPVIVTSTASGKTLCYNLPVLYRLSKIPEARALYLFPTKALAHDQMNNLALFTDKLSANVSPAVYDGDTPSSARVAIRNTARVVISNPDMLHTGILPHHTSWAQFFSNLHIVVLDEVHTYRGVFGSHVANVLRRLRRICRFYGSNPQFILTSATIANPGELAQNLIEEPVSVIDQDGSKRGEQTFIVYNPPVTNPALGLRRSALHEAIRLADDLLTYDIQTVIFGRSRRSVEIMLAYLQERAIDQSTRGYRSGYLRDTRREIESGLRTGSVRAVVATNALELGIDIGGMGAALLVGYPGTIAATRQQAGRAGRGEQQSLSIFVATADPLDQYLARFPDYFIQTPPEQALINPDNPLILLNHLRCAAFELPFQPQEGFGHLSASIVHDYLQFLLDEGSLHQSGERYFWMANRYPAQAVSLRSTSPEQVILQVIADEKPVTLGMVDYPSAHWLVHEKAVYLHEAHTYIVEQLDLERKIASLRATQTDYYTEPRQETKVELLEQLTESAVIGATKNFGEITVTSQVVGFRKIRWHTHETLGHGELQMPAQQLLTTGYWISIKEETVQALQDEGLWNNAPNDYGHEWNRVKALVRSRDGYQCVVCGVAENDRNHDVHHKIPFRTFRDSDGNIQHHLANRLDNLITVCRRCHHRIETVVRVRSGLTGLAFTLSHLAPLMIMCDRRDLGVHTDPQAPISQGKPTIVLYDQVPAGIGLSQRLFEQHEVLLNQAIKLITSCGCVDGCPSCVGPGGELGEGGKPETLAILRKLTSR